MLFHPESSLTKASLRIPMPNYQECSNGYNNSYKYSCTNNDAHNQPTAYAFRIAFTAWWPCIM